MCVQIIKHSCGELEKTGNDITCSSSTADGDKCQRYTLLEVETDCGQCHVCKPEVAEAKHIAEAETRRTAQAAMEILVKRAMAATREIAKENAAAKLKQKETAEEETMGKGVRKGAE